MDKYFRQLNVVFAHLSDSVKASPNVIPPDFINYRSETAGYISPEANNKAKFNRKIYARRKKITSRNYINVTAAIIVGSGL